MRIKRIILSIILLATTTAYSESINPFTHPSVSLSGGFYWVEFQEGGAIVDFAADFPVAGSANDDGGFIFSIGPRINFGFSNYSVASSSIILFQGNAVSNDFIFSLKMAWSFRAGSGYIAPYLDIRPAFNMHYLTGSASGLIFGTGASSAVGLQYYFANNLGVLLEIEGGVSVPVYSLPIPFGYGAARAGIAYAF